MTAERQRIHLGPGLSIYREFLMWWLPGAPDVKDIVRPPGPERRLWTSPTGRA